MAEQAQIDEAKDFMSQGSVWDDAKINTLLDAGTTLPNIMVRYWQNYAANAVNFVSITEDGSSRDIKSIYDNAMKQVDYWKERVAQEEKPVVNETLRGRIAFHTITRV